MLRFARILTTLSVVFVLTTGTAAATPPPPEAPDSYPASVTLFPVEAGSLRSHFDLQFFYARPSAGGSSLNGVALAFQPQLAIADRFEVGLTIPFLLHAFGGAIGSSTNTEFGNIELGLKAKLWGHRKKRHERKDSFSISVFANTTLPTGSGLPTREFAAFQVGVAGSGQIAPMVTVGASTGAFWFATSGRDLALYQLDLWTAFRPLPLLGLQLLFQFALPVHPNTDDPAVSLTPAVQLWLARRFHVDLGVRIGANDGGKIYSGLARAAFILAAGMLF